MKAEENVRSTNKHERAKMLRYTYKGVRASFYFHVHLGLPSGSFR